MIKRIAVCLDGSELAEQVLPYASEIASRFGARVILLQVIGMKFIPPVPGLPEADTPGYTTEVTMEYDEAEEASATAYLEVIARTLGDLETEFVTPRGLSAARSIIEYTHENDIDLITLATHGRTGLGRTVLGSVADQVIRESHLPVLVIRPSETKD